MRATQVYPTMSPATRFLLSLGALVFLPALETEAQAVTLDEGIFQITIDGRPSGTEEFSIRRSGTGANAQIIAAGEILMEVPEGRLDLRPALRADGGDMAVSAYQIRISGHRQEEINVTLAERRYLSNVRSERGEQEREFRATAGTLLLDTGVAHQYYFLSTRFPSGGGTAPVIVPREGRQFDLRVTEVARETVTIGGQPIAARHLRLEGNQDVRDLWVDSEGRVLRIEHAASGYVATRERAP
jgi:hypothetical protein